MSERSRPVTVQIVATSSSVSVTWHLVLPFIDCVTPSKMAREKIAKSFFSSQFCFNPQKILFTIRTQATEEGWESRQILRGFGWHAVPGPPSWRQENQSYLFLSKRIHNYDDFYHWRDYELSGLLSPATFVVHYLTSLLLFLSAKKCSIFTNLKSLEGFPIKQFTND